MPAQALVSPLNTTDQDAARATGRIRKAKPRRPSRRERAGRRSWHTRLVNAGKADEAAAWAARWTLARPVADEADGPSETALAALAPLAAALPSAGVGVGVDQAAGRENGDKTTPATTILQCSSAAPAAEPADSSLIRGLTGDSLPLIAASPSGEVEGKMTNCQQGSIREVDMQAVTAEDCLLEKGWPKACEAWVGVRGRNKDWVDVQVTDSLWAKAWVRDVVVQYGTREAVRLKWVSADGRDAEYAFVKAAHAPEPPEEPDPVIEPISDPEPAVAATIVEPNVPTVSDENPSAGDFMERARMQAFMDYSR